MATFTPLLQPMSESDATFIKIKRDMDGIKMSNGKCNIFKMYIIKSSELDRRFLLKRSELEKETNTRCLVSEGFHGTPSARTIAVEGFDARRSHWGLYGKGVYLTPQAWKANFYAFGRDKGCARHNDQYCTSCTRLMLFCLCLMGRCFVATERIPNIPQGYHSVTTVPSSSRHPEVFAAVHGDQVLPYVLIEYNFVPTSALPPPITLPWRVPVAQEARPTSSSVSRMVDNGDYYRTQDEENDGERSSTGYWFQDLGVIIKLLLGVMVVGAFALVYKWASR